MNVDPIFGLPTHERYEDGIGLRWDQIPEAVGRLGQAVNDVEEAHTLALVEDERWRIAEYETLQAQPCCDGWCDY